jgi:DHA2 family multidrug resistance protein-like MFS transporter
VKATRREWLGLAVIALPCLLYAMDLTVLDLAVPRLVADLAPSSAELLWIIDIYGFVLAGALITMGTLGDRIGRRRLLLAGAAAFGLVSIAAAFSTSARMLIAMRALLGLAGATLAPSTLALIQTMFRDERERNFAIGVWGASFSAGTLIGPLLGGIVLAHASWHAVFLLGVPVMLALLVVGPRVLPEVVAERPGRLDLASAALSLVAVLCVIYGVKTFAHGEQGVLPLALGVLCGVWFVRRQRGLADPFIDLALFRIPTLTTGLVTNLLGVFVAFGVYLIVGQYLQVVRGLTPLATAVWMLPWSIGFIPGSLLAPIIARRVRPILVVVGGLALAAIGLIVLVEVDLVVGSLVFAIGLSAVPALATAMVVGSAPTDRAGAAAAISETGAELGGALGIAVLGSFANAIYRHHPGAVGESLAQASTAAARAAFGHAFEVTGLVGAGVLVATAVVLAIRARPPVLSVRSRHVRTCPPGVCGGCVAVDRAA